MNLGRAIGNAFFLGLFGLVFLGVGFAVMWWMGALTTLACEPPDPATRSGQCTLAQANVFGRVSRTQEVAVNELLGAEVEASSSDDGGDSYRVVLRTERGPVPFTDYYSSGRDEKQATAEAINAFVKDPAPAFEARQDERLFAALFGGIFALVGGGLSLGAVWSVVARLLGR